MISFVTGTIPFQIQLPDGATGLYPMGVVKDSSGNPVTTVSLSDFGDGMYVGFASLLAVGNYFVTYKVYNDSGHTSLNVNYGFPSDFYHISDPVLQLRRQYDNRIAVNFDAIGSNVLLLAWAERDGGIATDSTLCGVTIYSSLGTQLATASLSVPDSNGVYALSLAPTISGGKNYYAVINITVDGVARTSVQAFSTQG